MKSVFLSLLVIATTFLGANASAAAPPQLKGLDAYVHKVMKRWHTPGLAIAVVKDGKVVLAKGYGVRELGKPGKVDANTLFGIGSDSKQFTAAALGTLVQAGKLSWDARVARYIKHFRLKSPYVTRHLTLRDLLSHRSGYCDPLPMWYTSNADTAIKRMRYQQPRYGFRAHFCYNNMMFITGAHFIPAITGETYQSYIKAHLFRPLAMTRTVSTTAAVSAARNVAAPHAMVDGKMTVIRRYWTHNLDFIKSVGGIYSSVTDQAHWLIMMLNDGRYNGKRVLAPGVVREMETPQSLIERDSDVGGFLRAFYPGSHYYAYGLGLIIHDYGGHKLVSHAGDIEGMDAAIAMVPDRNLGVVVLANSWVEPSKIVMRHMLRQLLGMPPQDIDKTVYAHRAKAKAAFDAQEKKLAETRNPDSHASLPLEGYTGVYRDKFYGAARVSLENGHLVLRLENPYFIGDLEHWHDNTFRVTWRYPFYQNWFNVIGPVYATFDLSAYGKPTRLSLDGPDLQQQHATLHYERAATHHTH